MIIIAYMKLKKHPFILLELLIAMTLLSFTTLPFIHIPFNYLQNELKSLKKIELERIAELSIIETKALLYQNSIAWESLTKPHKPSLPDREEEVTLHLPGIDEKFKKRIYFWQQRQKKMQGEEELFLINVLTTFTSPKEKKLLLQIKQQMVVKQLPKKLP